MKENEYEVNNPTVTDNLVQDQYEEDDEDELEAIYNIDGTLNRFQNRATTIDLKKGSRNNGPSPALLKDRTGDLSAN